MILQVDLTNCRMDQAIEFLLPTGNVERIECKELLNHLNVYPGDEEDCQERAKEEGYQEGYDVGHKDGRLWITPDAG